MIFTIRPAEKKDMPEVLGLIRQLAKFEKEPDAVDIDVQTLWDEGFGAHPLFYCIVAETDRHIRGMALFYFRFSTWKGRTVHLEDLIVQQEFRGKGLGSALFKKVIEFADKHKVKRVEWAVLDWNKPAIGFYEKVGADILKDWYLAQFHRPAYQKYLKSKDI